MSKQRIDEMKKFMQIAEGNVAEAKVDPKLRKAGKILMQVVDGLDREYEELMNGADGDEEEIEFAEHVAEDAEDYKKIVNMLMKGQGKQAARFYDGLDTVSREFVYDHAYSDIEFLQKVFGDLGSDWLFLEYDDEYDESVNESDPDDTDWDAHWAREDGDEERADDLEWDAEWERMSEGWFDDLGTGEEFARGEKDVCKKCGREGCECGPDCDCEPLEEGTLFELGLVGAFLGFVIAKGWPKVRWYLEKKQVKDVLADFERNVSSAALEKYKADFEAKLKSTSPRSRDALMRKITYVEKVLDQLADFADNTDKLGNDKDYMPAQVRFLINHRLNDAMREVEKFVKQSNTGYDRRKAAKRRVAKEGIHLDSIVESVLSEDSYADYVDWEDEPGQDEPMTKGKSQVVKDVADELGLEVEDMPLVDPDEDDQLGLRFD